MDLALTTLLILAGGRATRLGSLTDDTPKYLAPIGSGKRFADVQLAWAHDQGFREIVLSVGYRGDDVRAYCGDGGRFGLSIRYCFDGPAPLGTAGALRMAFPQDEPYAVVVYGDTVLDLPTSTVVREAINGRAYALMTVYANDVPGHACNASLDGDRVLYSKTSPRADWRHIDYGFLVLSRGFVDDIAEPSPVDLAVPLERASATRRLSGHLATRRFWEIGTPDALLHFRAHFGSGSGGRG